MVMLIRGIETCLQAVRSSHSIAVGYFKLGIKHYKIDNLIGISEVHFYYLLTAFVLHFDVLGVTCRGVNGPERRSVWYFQTRNTFPDKLLKESYTAFRTICNLL